MLSDLVENASVYHDKYEVVKELGRGAFGVVFQIKDREDGKCYAAKDMKISNETQRSIVMKEIRLLNKIKHTKIIQFVGAFEMDVKRTVILVTEYLDGGELFERVVSEDFNLTETDACEFMKQILQGVEYLHRNRIVHLDLKPENIVCANKEGMDIKIIDFGMAEKVFPGVELRVSCGSVDYVAPEIVKKGNVTPAADMWSLGVICYVLIAGFSPFGAFTPEETFYKIETLNYTMDLPEFDLISRNAKDFIAALLQKSPKDRLSAKQCLENPWMLEDIRPSVIKFIDTNNLRKYVSKRKLKKCYNAVIAANKMSRRTIIKSTSGSLDSPAHSPAKQI